MRMFGGFSPAFFEEYHKHRPKSKPVGEYDMRQLLYEMFHYVRAILPYSLIISLDTLVSPVESHLHLPGRQGGLSMPVLLLNRLPLDYLVC